jgi:hypothetical protein
MVSRPIIRAVLGSRFRHWAGGMISSPRCEHSATTRAPTVALGLRTDNQHVPDLVEAISEFHEKLVFRYPVINNADELVVIRTLVKAEDVLEIVSAIWRRVEGDAIRARLDAANKGGQHPLEYWDMGGSSSAT